MRIKSLINWFILSTLAACNSVLELDIEDKEPRMVVNSILEAGCDSIIVNVALTRLVHSKDPWTWVEDAEVKLYENEKEVAIARNKGYGEYVFQWKVKYTMNYKIIVNTPSYGTAWGETRVPSLITNLDIQLCRDSTPEWNGYMNVHFNWQDVAQEDNFYWFGALAYYQERWDAPVDSTHLQIGYDIYCNSVLPDPFNSVNGEEHSMPVYFHYMRLEDSGWNGIQMSINFLCYGSQNYGSRCFILSADENYDAYIKSSIINYRYDEGLLDFPLFYEPSYTHWNVKGGVGLVASYAYWSKLYDK